MPWISFIYLYFFNKGGIALYGHCIFSSQSCFGSHLRSHKLLKVLFIVKVVAALKSRGIDLKVHSSTEHHRMVEIAFIIVRLADESRTIDTCFIYFKKLKSYRLSNSLDKVHNVFCIWQS